VRRTHTPSRTGLTSKAVRLPSRLGVTPGGKHPEEFVVPPSARTAAAAAAAAAAGPAGAAAPATAGNHNLKSILKRLNFSTAKGAAAAASVAAAMVPASEAAAGGQAASAAPAAAQQRQQQAQGQSTIKQLRFFDFAATPGPYGVAGSTAAGAPADRHVSFDAATVSPAVRSTRRPAAASAAAPAPLLRTPEPAIQEEDSGSGGEDAAGGAGGAGGSVNSARAGHTPFDRRLSSLFAKYQVGGTPELLPEAELDGLVAEGGWAGWGELALPVAAVRFSLPATASCSCHLLALLPVLHAASAGAVRSPAWHRLSSASVPESIRELTTKYVSDTEGSLRGLTPPDMTPLPASPASAGVEEMDQDEPAGTPVQAAGAAAAGSSPALAPTPHNIVDSVMQRNALYESPPVAPAAAAAVAAPSAAPTAAQEAAAAAAAGRLSPASALAALLAPVLVATIQQIHSDRQQASEAAISPTGGLPISAEFQCFPQADAMSVGDAASATPGASSGGPSPSHRSHDGVPRTVDGIPALTPHTVTVRRGSFGGGLGAVLEEDDDFMPAANLFDSFSPAAGSSPASADGFSPAATGASAAQQAAAEADAAPAATPAADFSFFPAASSHQQQQQAPAGVTPEMGGGAAAAAAAGGSMGGPAPTMISPEILGFYEQEAQRQRASIAATGAAAVPSSSQALGTPSMPRSAPQRP
jgi:hypothetical protein